MLSGVIALALLATVGVAAGKKELSIDCETVGYEIFLPAEAQAKTQHFNALKICEDNGGELPGDLVRPCVLKFQKMRKMEKTPVWESSTWFDKADEQDMARLSNGMSAQSIPHPFVCMRPAPSMICHGTPYDVFVPPGGSIAAGYTTAKSICKKNGGHLPGNQVQRCVHELQTRHKQKDVLVWQSKLSYDRRSRKYKALLSDGKTSSAINIKHAVVCMRVDTAIACENTGYDIFRPANAVLKVNYGVAKKSCKKNGGKLPGNKVRSCVERYLKLHNMQESPVWEISSWFDKNDKQHLARLSDGESAAHSQNYPFVCTRPAKTIACHSTDYEIFRPDNAPANANYFNAMQTCANNRGRLPGSSLRKCIKRYKTMHGMDSILTWEISTWFDKKSNQYKSRLSDATSAAASSMHIAFICTRQIAYNCPKTRVDLFIPGGTPAMKTYNDAVSFCKQVGGQLPPREYMSCAKQAAENFVIPAAHHVWLLDGHSTSDSKVPRTDTQKLIVLCARPDAIAKAGYRCRWHKYGLLMPSVSPLLTLSEAKSVCIRMGAHIPHIERQDCVQQFLKQYPHIKNVPLLNNNQRLLNSDPLLKGNVDKASKMHYVCEIEYQENAVLPIKTLHRCAYSKTNGEDHIEMFLPPVIRRMDFHWAEATCRALGGDIVNFRQQKCVVAAMKKMESSTFPSAWLNEIGKFKGQPAAFLTTWQYAILSEKHHYLCSRLSSEILMGFRCPWEPVEMFVTHIDTTLPYVAAQAYCDRNHAHLPSLEHRRCIYAFISDLPNYHQVFVKTPKTAKVAALSDSNTLPWSTPFTFVCVRSINKDNVKSGLEAVQHCRNQRAEMFMPFGPMRTTYYQAVKACHRVGGEVPLPFLKECAIKAAKTSKTGYGGVAFLNLFDTKDTVWITLPYTVGLHSVIPVLCVRLDIIGRHGHKCPFHEIKLIVPSVYPKLTYDEASRVCAAYGGGLPVNRPSDCVPDVLKQYKHMPFTLYRGYNRKTHTAELSTGQSTKVDGGQKLPFICEVAWHDTDLPDTVHTCRHDLVEVFIPYAKTAVNYRDAQQRCHAAGGEIPKEDLESCIIEAEKKLKLGAVWLDNGYTHHAQTKTSDGVSVALHANHAVLCIRPSMKAREGDYCPGTDIRLHFPLAQRLVTYAEAHVLCSKGKGHILSQKHRGCAQTITRNLYKNRYITAWTRELDTQHRAMSIDGTLIDAFEKDPRMPVICQMGEEERDEVNEKEPIPQNEGTTTTKHYTTTVGGDCPELPVLSGSCKKTCSINPDCRGRGHVCCTRQCNDKDIGFCTALCPKITCKLDCKGKDYKRNHAGCSICQCDPNSNRFARFEFKDNGNYRTVPVKVDVPKIKSNVVRHLCSDRRTIILKRMITVTYTEAEKQCVALGGDIPTDAGDSCVQDVLNKYKESSTGMFEKPDASQTKDRFFLDMIKFDSFLCVI